MKSLRKLFRSSYPEIWRQLAEELGARQGLERLDGVRLGALDDEGWFGQKFPPETDELQLSLDGLVTDRERLKTAFELFGATLDRLCHIGSAYEDDPGVKL